MEDVRIEDRTKKVLYDLRRRQMELDVCPEPPPIEDVLPTVHVDEILRIDIVRGAATLKVPSTPG